jgi:hypothetical protein
MDFVMTAPAAHNTAASFAKTVADSPDRAAAILLAADLLLPSLERGCVIDTNDLRAAMTRACGSTDPEGFWLWKDAYDACGATQLLFV